MLQGMDNHRILGSSASPYPELVEGYGSLSSGSNRRLSLSRPEGSLNVKFLMMTSLQTFSAPDSVRVQYGDEEGGGQGEGGAVGPLSKSIPAGYCAASRQEAGRF